MKRTIEKTQDGKVVVREESEPMEISKFKDTQSARLAFTLNQITKNNEINTLLQKEVDQINIDIIEVDQ